ncbi:MAG: hypothetical protein P8Y70_15890, partial [Candidatus Lokiarchaeota archaeon]
MAFIFAVKTPDFWKNSPSPPPDINPLVLQIPFTICLGYISLYPLGDFLFIALSKSSDEGLTIFHKYLSEYVINRSKSKKASVFLAMIFYFGIFVLPPFIISLLGVPFILIWISWMLFYPLMILTFYGAKGYIAGISNAYYHLPYLERSIFIGFEDAKRNFTEFLSDPLSRILIGLMLFVFVWAWISMIQTIGLFFTGKLAISTYSYSGMVFVTLLFGVIGYFTRFWGRKIKYRSIDIYFAAYLIAAVGINVLVNFLIVNIKKLMSTFNIWVLTKPISTYFLSFAWPAVIEEILLIIFTSYYFLVKNSNFVRNLKYSKITESGQTFDPVPLFNLIRHKEPKLREHAKNTLKLMYERIPLKAEIDLDQVKFKNPLMDGICDPDPKVSNLCYSILTQLEKDSPEVCLQWIIENIKTPNYDKSIPIAKSLIKADLEWLHKLPIYIIGDLIRDPEWRLKKLGLKILLKLTDFKDDLEIDFDFSKLLDDPNKEIQVLILEILPKINYQIPSKILLEKINHSNKMIRTAAIKNIKNLNLEELDTKTMEYITGLLDDPSSSVRASIFEVLAKFGNLRKLQVPITSLIEGLMSSNEKLRKSAILAIEKYYDERSKEVDLNLILERIDERPPEVLVDIFTLLGYIWEKDKKKIVKILKNYIKSDNLELREKVSQIFIQNFEKSPKLIIRELIKMRDLTKFISKGIITETLIKITKKEPNKMIPKIIKYLESENEDERLNAVMIIDDLINEYYDLIEIEPIMDLMKKETNTSIRKEAFKLLSKIAKKEPKALKSNLNIIFHLIEAQEGSLKNTLVRSLLEISRVTPEILDVNSIKMLLNDEDSFIRETCIRILSYMGIKSNDPISIIELLKKFGLNDEEWSVREATVKSLGSIYKATKQKDPILESLISVINDREAWVRKASMDIISEIDNLNPKILPFNTIIENLKHPDSKVRESAANLIKVYKLEEINKIFNDILRLLEDKSEDVRKSMINSLVLIINEIGLKSLLNRLLQNLSDDVSLDLQRSVATILKRTAKYSNEEIKKRIIALLKIRCEMSQDPVICDAFHQIKE